MKLKTTMSLMSVAVMLLATVSLLPTAMATVCSPPGINLVCAQAYANGYKESGPGCTPGTVGVTCFYVGASGHHTSDTFAVAMVGTLTLTVAGSTVGGNDCGFNLKDPGVCDTAIETHWPIPNAALGTTNCILASATTDSVFVAGPDTYGITC